MTQPSSLARSTASARLAGPARRFLTAAVLTGALAVPAAPQDVEPDGGGRSRPEALGIWSALGRNQVLETRLGRTHQRDLYMIGLRAIWALGGIGRLRTDYTVDVIPLAVSTGMPMYEPVPNSRCYVRCVLPGRQGANITAHTARGIGVVPLGMQWRVEASNRVSLAARTSVGVIAFSRKIPDPDERRLNFTLDAGGSLDIALTRALELTAGVRLNHISNAGTGPVNPGMNSVLLEIGVMRRAH